MDSSLSVVTPFKSSTVFAEAEKQKSDALIPDSGFSPREMKVQKNDSMDCNKESSIGVLEVYVHQARDIHNICIYHKQDVYAKVCLTSDPEQAVSTQTINGGGRNPVFNQNLRLNVRTVDSSVKCEIWMLSRVRNYLEDQLLGFALVPLSEVIATDGKLENEFSLSSTDLFHSPAGFVQLSLSYNGASPDVMVIPALPKAPIANNAAVKDSDLLEPIPDEFDKIEFPDPQVVNENQMMVSEYFGVECTNLESTGSDSLSVSENENNPSRELGALVVESFSKSLNSIEIDKHDSPSSSCVSTNGSSATYGSPITKEFLMSNGSPIINESPMTSESPMTNESLASEVKDGNGEAGDGENFSSGELTKPLVSVNIEPEQKMVQQDIVDMYMKSMQQFTESLAKMKLPLDIENGPTDSGNSSTSDEKLQAPKTPGSRVFYGSRAFF